MTDFDLSLTGNLALLQPLTPRARRWLASNLTGEQTTFAGATVIERPYLSPILDAIAARGLAVSTPTHEDQTK